MTTAAPTALSDLLRTPEDLAKLTALRSKLVKERGALEAKLQEGVRSQLDGTRDALLRLADARAAAGMLREEMAEVERLKREEEGAGGATGASLKGRGATGRTEAAEAFEKITRVSGVHRNFSQTARMVEQLQTMADKVDHLHALLKSDRMHSPMSATPNLLPIHFELSKLDAFKNETLQEARNAAHGGATGAGGTRILTEWFRPLDELAQDFESWLWELAENVVESHPGTVVRLLKIIDFESQLDEKAVAMRLMRKVGTDAGKLRGMQGNARVIKNYRHKLLDAIDGSVTREYARAWSHHQMDEGGDTIEFVKGLAFIFDDVIRIKDMGPLFPENYEIEERLVKKYHQGLNEMLRKIVSAGPEAAVLLFLHGWIKDYRGEMKKEGVPSAWLQPPLLDGKAGDLIEDYVKLIITKLDEWTKNLQKEETHRFKMRMDEPHQNPDGTFGLSGVVDFFQLVNQQIDLAIDSGQGAVVARVVTESAKVMRRVQGEWAQLVGAQARLQAEKRPDEIPGGLVEYVMALANDQLRAANYVEELSARISPMVSEKYQTTIVEVLNESIDGYLDVAKRSTTALVEFVFNDLRPATRMLLTPQWSDALLQQVIATMGDYMADYQSRLSPSIYDILVDDMIDAFLITYLTAVRRAAPNSLRMPVAAQRMRSDVGTAFKFFSDYKQPAELEPVFEVMDAVVAMLSASYDMIIMDYWDFARTHGPQFAFVEALLKARDDLDRNTVTEIMESLRRRIQDEGITDPEDPTIMVKIHGDRGGLMANLSNLGNLAGSMVGQTRNFATGVRERM